MGSSSSQAPCQSLAFEVPAWAKRNKRGHQETLKVPWEVKVPNGMANNLLGRCSFFFNM